jgi:16S rRNA processing protein RimM
VDTIGQAEALSGAEILVAEESRAPLESGLYFVDDLVGCAVTTREGVRIGLVTGVWEAGGSALLVVERGAGGAEVFIPLSGAICPVIDTAAKAIVIDPPDGLLDLNEI